MIRKGKKSKIADKFKGMLRFKKISGGIHNNRDGQVVRKGEILYARELGPILSKGFECLDTIKESFGGVSLGIKARGKGWYDVINKKTGEKLNDKAMKASEAKQFITGDFLPEKKDVENGEEADWAGLLDLTEEGLLEVNDENELGIAGTEWETEDDLRVLVANLLKIDIEPEE